MKSSLWRAWKGRQLVLNSALGALWANIVVQLGTGSSCQSWTPEGWRMHIPQGSVCYRGTAPGAGWLIWVLGLCPKSSGTSLWSQGGLGCPNEGTFGISRAHPCSLIPGRKLGCLPPNPAFLPG